MPTGAVNILGEDLHKNCTLSNLTAHHGVEYNAHTLPQKDNEGQLRKLESRDALQVTIRKGEERGHLCQAL